MATVRDETEERIMSSRSVIFPIVINKHFGLSFWYRTEKQLED